MRYLLAIDQGTSSTRAMLHTVQGRVVCTSQYEINQYYPRSGWVEHDPEEIWQKTLIAIRDVVATVEARQIIACGLTNQRETVVIWDKQTGTCLAPAIVWQDRRTQEFCLTLSAHAAMINAKTGLLPDPYFSASKLHWLLNHVPAARELIEQNRLAFGTIDSFLIWRLTGGAAHLTDVTNASRTLLLTTIAYRIQGKTVYGLEGSLYQAGTTVKWLRDELQVIQLPNTKLLPLQL